MKLLSILAFLFSISTYAQTVSVEKIDSSQDTTISIKKGSNTPSNESAYEITQGEDDIVGDGAVMSKEAKANWKSACSAWKKETKELNKDNQVITLNCGSPECSSTAHETVCKSKGTHKIKVRIK